MIREYNRAVIHSSNYPPRIRQLDTHKDFLQVADLIELCFEPHLDPDGLLYLQQIRRAANNAHLVRWSYAAGELVSYPLNGYVYEMDGKIVGNLSLIPIYWQKRWIYLVANVAVLPQYRQQGIARRLTEHALEHVRNLPVPTVWLHVREDNHVARHLYEKFGFVARSRRDTWVSHDPFPDSDPIRPAVEITNRNSSDWGQQLHWLKEIYPPEVNWHLSFSPEQYRTGFFSSVLSFLEGKKTKHWAARKNNQLLGIASWEPSFTYADPLFLATDPTTENLSIPSLLPFIKQNHSPYRPLIINFPAGRAKEAFECSGFNLLNTLIWMENKLT